MFRDRDGWRVQWKNRVTGKRESEKFPTKIEAKLFESKLKAGLIRSPTLATMTFGEFCDVWLEKHCKKEKVESQWVLDEGRIRNHVKPFLGHVRLSAMRKTDLQDWRLDLRQKIVKRGLKPLSVKTVNHVIVMVRSILSAAVEWEYLSEKLWEGLKLFPLPERAINFWTVEERDTFYRFARQKDPEFAELVMVACHTGLRAGELAALKRHQIDFDRRMIQVDATFCSVTKQRMARTKNRRIGWVPMNDEALKHLGQFRLLSPEALVFNQALFIHPSPRLRRLCKAVGSRPIRFHDLRHTFASSLVTGGIELYTVSRLMRHQTPTMTARYAHLADSSLHQAISVLSMARKPARTEAEIDAKSGT